MTRIASNNHQPVNGPKPVAKASAPTTPAIVGPRQQLEHALTLQKRLSQAVAQGQFQAARQIQAQLRPIVGELQKGAGANPARAAIAAQLGAAMQVIDRQLQAAPRPAPRPAAPAPAPQSKGPLAWLGSAVAKAGAGMEKVGKVAFFPLTAIGKVLDPVRETVGHGLSKVKQAIDESVVGKAPVIGSAVRFTTGLASSVVGMVDGAIQGVTHPVELIKGIGHIAGTVVGLVPGPKQVWDYAVHGKDPVTSYKEGLADAKNLAVALVEPALNDFKAGNYAGGIGRLTGDIGSLFLTGGAAGGAKVAEVGVVAGRAGKLGAAMKMLKTGARVIGAADELGATILKTGMKANLAPIAKAGKVLAEAAPLRQVASLADNAAALEGRMAAPAAVAKKAKAAFTFAEDALKGEVRMANAPDLASSVAAQKELLGKLGGVPVYEHLSDAVRGALVDTEHKLIDAVKGLKLNGKPVTSLEDAAEAWKALPENAPERVAIGKKLAGAMQESFAEGLKYPPAPVEFTALPEHLAGLQQEAKVLLDPSLLNEDLRYLVDVMAEEQTHAYQRFLTENKGALTVDPKMAAEIEKYAKEFQVEHYLNPPAAGLEALARGIDGLAKPLRDLADSADEVLVRNLRKEVAPGLAKGTPERAMLDSWYATAGPESEKLSFMKWANSDLAKASKHPTAFKTWIGDYADRLPEGIAHVDGVPRSLEEVQANLSKAIKESQGVLSQAHGEVTREFSRWMDAYRGQSLEFTAQQVASDVARWMFGS